MCFQIGPNISFPCQEALGCCSPSLEAEGLCRAQPEPLLVPVLGPSTADVLQSCRASAKELQLLQVPTGRAGSAQTGEKRQHFYCTRSYRGEVNKELISSTSDPGCTSQCTAQSLFFCFLACHSPMAPMLSPLRNCRSVFPPVRCPNHNFIPTHSDGRDSNSNSCE